jgi:hypothetical protein
LIKNLTKFQRLNTKEIKIKLDLKKIYQNVLKWNLLWINEQLSENPCLSGNLIQNRALIISESFHTLHIVYTGPHFESKCPFHNILLSNRLNFNSLAIEKVPNQEIILSVIHLTSNPNSLIPKKRV